MKLNKSSSFVLMSLLQGNDTAKTISQHLGMDIRSTQRALLRLVNLNLIIRRGSNNPSYSVDYGRLVCAEIPPKLLENETRPNTSYNFQLIDWLKTIHNDQLYNLIGDTTNHKTDTKNQMSAKELEYLTVELSWKSSALEGNTYTLLDTQLLITEGIKAKNKTEFETQMILNHKNAVMFIMENPDLFMGNITFSTVEELHRIIGYNLGIESGIRKKIVHISASNYRPVSGAQQLREQMDTILSVISRTHNPFIRALLALAFVPYLQAFEDGNKRTGRMLANALLIHSLGKGFSLRGTDQRKLALAYLSFYEFNSIKSLQTILRNELQKEKRR